MSDVQSFQMRGGKVDQLIAPTMLGHIKADHGKTITARRQRKPNA